MDSKTFFSRQAAVLNAADLKLIEALFDEGQSHLFENWQETETESQRSFLESLHLVEASYPGGLIGYLHNARALLAGAASELNPFEGYTPSQPDLVDLSDFGTSYDEAEALGFTAFAQTAVVLVAGGLGERLGYHGIKLDIPVEVTENTPYLAHYAGVILAASRRLGSEIPLIIMTSRDTHDATVATLEKNSRFGLAENQVILLRQELVPALSDINARLALEGPCRLALKPHGHGDIHMLLHTSGTARRLANAGTRYLLFIQDTNAHSLNAAFAAIGVSEKLGYDFNSIAVNRIPGEAVGGITRLVKPGHPDLTLNVEYNQLDPLLRATVSPEGDVPDARGFSMFPGNVNLLVIRLEPYLKVLESSGGIIAEFVNPKFADATKTTFKKPARLETMMQDLPKLFVSGEKVGVTVFDRTWCFSACKNALDDAAAKVRAGGPAESASSAENDFYEINRRKLVMAGMRVEETPATDVRGVPFVTGPRVLLRPSFALTLADVKNRIRGGQISGDATLILEGDVHVNNLTMPSGSSLKVSAGPEASFLLEDFTAPIQPGFELVPLTDGEMASAEVPEFLRIRGYRIVNHGAKTLRANKPGNWKVDSDGELEILNS